MGDSARTGDAAKSSLKRVAVVVVSTVPMIAMPSAEPTCRIVLLPPDAMPLSARDVEQHQIGSCAIARPRPNPYNPSTAATLVTRTSTSMIWLRISSAIASITIPPVTIHLGPSLDENDPANGAAKNAAPASGSSAKPVSNADSPFVPCKNRETANSTPISPRLTIMPMIIPKR